MVKENAPEMRHKQDMKWTAKATTYLVIKVKGRYNGMLVRPSTSEWYEAQQLAETYWLYVVWDSLENPDAEPIRIQNPAQKPDHVKREVVTARFFEIPAEAISTTNKMESL